MKPGDFILKKSRLGIDNDLKIFDAETRELVKRADKPMTSQQGSSTGTPRNINIVINNERFNKEEVIGKKSQNDNGLPKPKVEQADLSRVKVCYYKTNPRAGFIGNNDSQRTV